MIQTRMDDINEAFFKAVQASDVKMINELLNRGADIHFMDDRALLRSFRFGTIEISRLLLDRGANVNPKIKSYEMFPLGYAIHCANLELLNILLEYNVDVNAENGRALRLCIYYMWTDANNERAEIMAKLLEHGADVRCNNKSILIGLEKNFNEKIADLLLPYCNNEDYCYFPNTYIRERIVATKGARNI